MMMRRMINFIFSLLVPKTVHILLILPKDVNLSTPLYKNRGLLKVDPFDFTQGKL
jgi:hypothetical protein